MLWQSFCVPLCVEICMLMEIHLIGFFLQMTHEYSITTYGGQRDKDYPFQGLCQGNGSIPTGWVGVSYMILQHQSAQGNVSNVTNCISLYLLILVTLLYVNDGELFEDTQSANE